MRVTSLSNVVFGLIKKGKCNERDIVRIADGFTQVVSRGREELQAHMLPKDIRLFFQSKGVANPVISSGYNSRPGSVVAGLVLKDGQKPVAQLALGLDRTHGAPILQVRGRMFGKAAQKAGHFHVSMNPNAQPGNASDFVQNFSKKQGAISFHSELGNSNLMDMSITSEAVGESSFLNAVSCGELTEDSIRDGLKELMAKNFVEEVNKGHRKLTELFAARTHVHRGNISRKKSAKGVKEAMTKARQSVEETGSKTLQPETVAGKHYGKRKVKRYLYHLTTEENYQQMLQDGKINMTNDWVLEHDGVFMLELDNFTKHWGTAKEWDKIVENPDGFYLSLALLGQTSKGTGKVVCLRIPTANLDHDLLKIRSQNKLALNVAKEHLQTGAPAREARLYGNRKEAVEYIYSEDIPMNRVEYIGSATAPGSLEDWDKMKIWTKSEQKTMVLDTFRELFRGRPEAKAFENLA